MAVRKAATKKAATKKAIAKKAVAKRPVARKVAKKAATKRAVKKTAASRRRTTARKSPMLQMRDARQFALQANFGMSSRLREMLDENRAPLKELVKERLPLPKIQEFIKSRYGAKIGPKALTAYLEGTFDYTPAQTLPRRG